MFMAKKTIVSLILIVLGVGIGILVIFTYAMSGGKASITLAFLAVAIVCIVAGSILAFSRLLDRTINPVLDELHKDVEDDLQDLKEHRLTTPIWMIILTGFAGIVFSFFVFRLHKLEAMWGSIPVAIPTILAMIALAWFVPRTRWFKNHHKYTPMWVFLIPSAGLILTLGFGLSKTENLSVIGAARQDPVEYNISPSTQFFLWQAADVGGRGLSVDIPSCDGDDCVVYLVIALVILVFILVVGSALIPHFWLLSGSLLVGIMALIALHDLLVRRDIKNDP